MLLCAAMWSIAGIFIKLIPWNAFAIAGLRSLFAGLTLLSYIAIKRYRIIMNRKTLLSGFFLGAVFILFVSANKLTTAANAIVLQFTSPLFIVLISAVLYKKKIRRNDLIAVLATFVGIALFFLDELEGGYFWGNICGVAAGLFFASVFIINGDIDAEERFSGQLIGHAITFLFGLPFALMTGVELSGVPLLNIIILGVFQLGIPYVLYGLAAEHCPPLACCLLGAVEPLLNPVWVLIFDGERPGTLALIGAVVVITSVTLWCAIGNREKTAKE